MDERLNIDADPEDLLKALMGVDPDPTDDDTDENDN